MASRDWHRKTAGSEPKSSKFVARDRTVVAYPAEMTWFLAHPEITVQRRHWLADDAVWIGPVSDPDSLLAGNLQGILPHSALWEPARV
jgi:hypothetical protein